METNKIAAIIQARMSSTRLPGKVMLRLGRSTVLEQVIRQVSYSKMISEIIVATSEDSSDDVIEVYCREIKIRCVRGSLDDVLERYWLAARMSDAEIFARITADCPLIDPVIIDEVVSSLIERRVDYASNINPPTFPDGLDVEVFTRVALERAHREAALPSEREHVTPYIRNHGELFTFSNIVSAQELSHLRWTLDTADDYKLLGAIFSALESEHGPILHTQVLSLLASQPHLTEMNSHHQRNSGMRKSLEADEQFKKSQ